MNTQRKSRYAFRPTLGGVTLEDRTVLSTAGLSQGLTALVLAPTATTPGLGNLTIAQLRSGFAQQHRAVFFNLRQSINNQAAQLFQSGRPTQQQLADFTASTQGAINAAALQLSSQFSLLPGASSRLVSNLQNGLLGSGSRSLSSRIQTITQLNRFTNSAASFQTALNRVVNNSSLVGGNQLARFFNTTPFRRLSVDPQTGARVPIGQFVGNRLVNQFGNTFGSLASSFSNVASGLFANGATPTTAAVNAFNQQATNALGTAAFQLGSALALFPNATSTLSPQIQSAFLATGNNPSTGLPFNSLANSLQSLPFTTAATPGAFNTAAQNAFTGGFGSVVSPLFSFFGLQTPAPGANGLPNFTVPSAPFTNPFGSQFTGNTFNSGFNNGFGSGFMGFGQAPTTGFNTNFGTGFNSFIGSANTGLGFGSGSTFGLGSGPNGGPATSGGTTTGGFTNTGSTITTGGSMFPNGAGGFFQPTTGVGGTSTAINGGV